MKKPFKITLKIVLGIVVSAGLLFLLFHKVNFNKIGKILERSSIALIISAGIIHTLSYFIIGFRWKLLLGEGLSTVKLSLAVMSGYLFNLIFFRTGDVLKCFLIKKEYPLSHSAASVVVEGSMDTFVVFILTFLPLFFLKSVPHYLKRILLIPAILFILFIIFLIFSMKSKSVEKVLKWILGYLPFSKKLLKFYDDFKEKIIAMTKHPKSVFVAFIVTIFLWFTYLIFFTLTVKAVGLHVNLGKMCFILGVTTLGMNVPAGVGFIGTFHFAFYQASISLGVEKNLAIASGFILHLNKVLGHAIMGLIGISFQKMPSLNILKNNEKNKNL